MKVGDLVEFINPVDKVVYRDAIGLVISIEEYTPDDPDWPGYPTMVTIHMKNEDESYDFPIDCLTVKFACS